METISRRISLFPVYVWDTGLRRRTRIWRPLKVYFSVQKMNVRVIQFLNVRESLKSQLKALPYVQKMNELYYVPWRSRATTKREYRYRKITQGKKRQEFRLKRSSPLPPSWMHQMLTKTYRINRSRYPSNTNGSLIVSGKPALKRELFQT